MEDTYFVFGEEHWNGVTIKIVFVRFRKWRDIWKRDNSFFSSTERKKIVSLQLDKRKTGKEKAVVLKYLVTL